MCHPVALAVLGGVQSGLQFAGQHRQAKQQAQFQQRAAEAERQRSLMEQRSIGMRRAQEEVAMKTEIGKIARQAEDARATATVAKGEKNIAGLSVDALLNDYYNQEAQHRALYQQQGEWKDVQAELALTDAGFRSQNRLIDIDRPVPRTSFLTGAMNVASSAISGGRTGLELKRLTDKPKIS